MSEARVPILTWHSNNVSGNDYASNDHVALREDLETLHDLGLRIVPLHAIAEALREGRLGELRGCVGLSFDDGSDLDFHDAPHPVWGPQRGFFRILEDFRARHGAGAQPELHATAFVIVSPDARRQLDRTCLIGCGWWNHDWWAAAEASGLMAVESHGWDHNHETLKDRAATAPAGGFDLAGEHDADAEIAQASRVLAELRGRAAPVLFAYPYGHASPYLAREYLPQHGLRHGVAAAFTNAPKPVTPETPIWEIPRYVCGLDWKSPRELAALLGRGAGTSPAGKPEEPRARTWREHLKAWEVHDASRVAGDLFRRCFGHPIPDYPRHFVLVYSPPPGLDEAPSVVAYVHQTPFKDMYLTGGMCVDERIYRRMPGGLFAQVREEGGLATIVTRESLAFLGEAPAIFGHVGEPRARQADLRTGFVDTDRPHLMAIWRRRLSAEEKERRVAEVALLGPF